MVYGKKKIIIFFDILLEVLGFYLEILFVGLKKFFIKNFDVGLSGGDFNGI